MDVAPDASGALLGLTPGVTTVGIVGVPVSKDVGRGTIPTGAAGAAVLEEADDCKGAGVCITEAGSGAVVALAVPRIEEADDAAEGEGVPLGEAF